MRHGVAALAFDDGRGLFGGGWIDVSAEHACALPKIDVMLMEGSSLVNCVITRRFPTKKNWNSASLSGVPGFFVGNGRVIAESPKLDPSISMTSIFGRAHACSALTSIQPPPKRPRPSSEGEGGNAMAHRARRQQSCQHRRNGRGLLVRLRSHRHARQQRWHYGERIENTPQPKSSPNGRSFALPSRQNLQSAEN